jgi:hypothetical protein
MVRTGGAVTVIVAVADLVPSATLVALTVKLPAALGAVYRPAALTVPPLASTTVQVTEVLAFPVTVAPNCAVSLAATVVGASVIVITTTPGALTVIVAVADLVVSATLVALTVKVPAALGAVYRSVLSTVPPWTSTTVQVTEVLELPVTVAVNCAVAFVRIDAVVGVIDTATTTGAVTVTVAVADLVPSATLVAVTRAVPAALGVNKPAVLTVPPMADQVTAVLTFPVTVAVNCAVAFVRIDAVVGAAAVGCLRPPDFAAPVS